MNTATIGSRLKALREQCGFTQSMVASYLDVDQSLISKAEGGTRALTADMLEKLAALYGVQVAVLLKSDAEVKPLSFALRARTVAVDDLKTIGAINLIALNGLFMTSLLDGDYPNG